MNTRAAGEPVFDFDVTLPARPYPGLRRFEKDEWAIFFGRERMTDEVVERLVREQFLLVHGDSGCGKSSLICAGVLPRLEQDNARGGLTWRTASTQPGNAPLQLLAEALADLDGRKNDAGRVLEIRRLLNSGVDAPGAVATLLRRSETDHICLLVDQFEELFSFARRQGPDEAKLFVQFLVGMVERPPAGLYVVATMRSEFLGACAHFTGLAEAVNEAQYLLPRMSHADLMRAVREPASLYNGQISADLAERVITDSGGSQDQLPLIQHGLMLMYQRKAIAPGAAWRLDLSEYAAIGDLGRALSDHADEVLATAEQPPFPVAERLFRSITEINADGQAVRRPQTIEQLAAAVGDKDRDRETLVRVINAFRAEGASFLRPYGDEPLVDGQLVDISHEALIRCWTRIASPKSGWLVREFQDGLIWRALLVQAENFDRNPTHLLTLPTAEEQQSWLDSHNAAWAGRYGGGWKLVERLVQMSTTTGRAQRDEEENRAVRQRRYARAFVAFLIAVALFGFWQNRQTRNALALANSASAASLWNRLDFTFSNTLRNDELMALWEVRLAPADVKRAFVDELKRNNDRVLQLSQRPAVVLRALAIGPEDTEAVRDSILSNIQASPDVYQLAALCNAASHLADRLTAEQAPSTFHTCFDAVATTNDDEPILLLSSALPRLAESLTPDQALEETVPLFIPNPEPYSTLDKISDANALLGAVAGRLTGEQAKSALRQLLGSAAQATDDRQGGALASAGRAIAAKLSADEAYGAFPQSLLASNPVSPLPLIADALARQLRPEQAAEALARVVRSSSVEAGLERFAVLTPVMLTLAGKLTPEQVRQAANPLLEVVSGTADNSLFAARALMLLPLAPSLSREQAQRVLPRLVQTLTLVKKTAEVSALASVVGALADQLTPAQNQQALATLLRLLQSGTNNFTLDAVATTVHWVAVKMTPPQAMATLTTVLQRARTSTDQTQLVPLVSMLPVLAAKLTPEDAGKLLNQTWTWIAATTNAYQLRALSFTVPTIARRLGPDQARQELPAVVSALVRTMDPDQIGAFSIAVQTLAEGVPVEQQSAWAGQILDKIRKETDPDRLARMAPAIHAIAGTLTPQQAMELLPRVLEAINSTVATEQLAFLGEAFQALSERFTEQDAASTLPVVMRALVGASDPDRINALLVAAHALSTRIGPALPDPIRSAVAWSPTDELSTAATRFFLASRPPNEPAEHFISTAAELLKYPTLAGAPTSLVLDAIQSRAKDAPGSHAGLRSNLEWISRTYPAIDASSPPVCPDPMLPGVTCPADR